VLVVGGPPLEGGREGAAQCARKESRGEKRHNHTTVLGNEETMSGSQERLRGAPDEIASERKLSTKKIKRT